MNDKSDFVNMNVASAEHLSSPSNDSDVLNSNNGDSHDAHILASSAGHKRMMPPEYFFNDPSFDIIDRCLAMPYEHHGVDYSANRVKLRESELLQYAHGSLTLDGRYVEQRMTEQPKSNDATNEETSFWSQFWDQRKEQRELLNSGAHVVLNENGQIIAPYDRTAAAVIGERGAIHEHNNNDNVPRVQPPAVLFPFLGAAAADNDDLNNEAENLPEVEEERHLYERQRETEAIIARHVQQLLLTTNTHFEVVRMFPEAAASTTTALPTSLTFRRICFAVLAVAASFVCIMIQSLPPPYLGDEKEMTAHNMMERDHLMHDLFDIRDWNTHLKYCGSINNHLSRNHIKIKTSAFLKYFTRDTYYDCSAGVLHIPTKKKLLSQSGTGISATWRLDCSSPINGTTLYHPNTLPLSENSGLDAHDDSLTPKTCADSQQERANHNGDGDKCRSKQPVEHYSKQGWRNKQQCFRGVHDDILLPQEVDSLIELGSELIAEGGDHIVIRNDTDSVLTSHAPTVLLKLEQLLHRHYITDDRQSATNSKKKPIEIKPVAFRFHAAISPLPHSHHETTPVNHILERLINQTVIREWIEPIYQKHVKTSLMYLLFPPISVKTSVLLTSDPCLLTSELEMRSDFTLHTSIFLAEKGSGEDYTGGATFYVQEKEWNAHRRWRRRYKIHRGLAIDGSRGRIIVSTGGNENLRCHLPLKAGVRAVLQIWWDIK